jgi:GWxTD domain-containing protein
MLALPLLAQGQGPGFGGKPETFEPVIKVDWAAFRSSEPGKSRLEVYYQVYNFGLQFGVDGQEFVASYDCTAEVFDGDGHQVESYERSRQVRVANQAQTKSRYDYRTSQFNLNLDPGKYTVRFMLTDKGSRTQIQREVKVVLPEFNSSEAELSSLEFVQSISASTDSTGVFIKGDTVMIPSVGREYGGDEDPKLWLYSEIYPGSDSTDRVILEAVIRHRSRGVVFRDTTHLSMDRALLRKLLQVDVGDFPPGDYELEATLHGRRMKDLDQKNETFSIMWTQEALIKLDWKSALSQLSYISTPGEMGKAKKAKTVEERRTAFDEFWNQRDPSAGTAENETKREFYRRINVANRQFSALRREGWKCDRGRIYIIHGEPDQIDDEPYSPDAVPYQIWHYYREGRYRRFVFVDKNDDGDYRLQFPYDGLNQRPDF